MESVAANNSEVLGDTALQTRTLESNASAKNYHEWLCSLAMPYLGDHPLEIGSGLGEYAQFWLDNGLPRVTVTEVDQVRRGRIQARFAGDDRVHVSSIDLDAEVEKDYSAVVSFNVLEHIPDDVAALRAARSAARVGGKVITFAPAFPSAMSQFDRLVGHLRRYTIASMRGAYAHAGLRVEVCHYVNAPGLIAWMVGMRMLRMTPTDGPVLRVWDRHVVPRARDMEDRRRPPMGQSVFCVGVRDQPKSPAQGTGSSSP